MPLNTSSAQDGPQQRALAPGSAVPRSRAVASRCRSGAVGQQDPRASLPACGPTRVPVPGPIPYVPVYSE